MANEDIIWRQIEESADDAKEVDFDKQLHRHRKLNTLLALDELTKRDISWRLGARREYAKFFKWFLILQNFLVGLFVFVGYNNAIRMDDLENYFKLQPIFSVLITGTIIQTAYIIQIM